MADIFGFLCANATFSWEMIDCEKSGVPIFGLLDELGRLTVVVAEIDLNGE